MSACCSLRVATFDLLLFPWSQRMLEWYFPVGGNLSWSRFLGQRTGSSMAGGQSHDRKHLQKHPILSPSPNSSDKQGPSAFKDSCTQRKTFAHAHIWFETSMSLSMSSDLVSSDLNALWSDTFFSPSWKVTTFQVWWLLEHLGPLWVWFCDIVSPRIMICALASLSLLQPLAPSGWIPSALFTSKNTLTEGTQQREVGFFPPFHFSEDSGLANKLLLMLLPHPLHPCLDTALCSFSEMPRHPSVLFHSSTPAVAFSC